MRTLRQNGKTTQDLLACFVTTCYIVYMQLVYVLWWAIVVSRAIYLLMLRRRDVESWCWSCSFFTFAGVSKSHLIHTPSVTSVFGEKDDVLCNRGKEKNGEKRGEEELLFFDAILCGEKSTTSTHTQCTDSITTSDHQKSTTNNNSTTHVSIYNVEVPTPRLYLERMKRCVRANNENMVFRVFRNIRVIRVVRVIRVIK